jgi:hypothetical protein
VTEHQFPRLNRARAAASGESTGDEQRPDPATWVSSLGSGAESDTMLRFAPSAMNSIDVTDGNSSGLSQLMLGRRTRLSTLLKTEEEREQARSVSLALRAKVRELNEERGIDVGALAVGVASWTAVEDGRRERRSAPVLLARIATAMRRGARGRDEMEVQIVEQAELNPALVRNLRRHHGIELDVEAFHHAAYAMARLEPAPALHLLEEKAGHLPDFRIEHRLLVSTFADLGDTARVPESLAERPVVEALYDAGTGMVPRRRGLQDTGLLPVAQRQAADERLVLDADPSQQRVLDHAAAGESFLVQAAPGTGQTQTAANLAAQLSWEGKRVLVVAERAAALRDVEDRLASVGLRDIVLEVPAHPDPEPLRSQLVRAVLRAERAPDPQTGQLLGELAEHRSRLSEHVASLHHVRPRWGCSPYQAMQALAALTSLPTAPATTVRLKRSVLDSTVNRQAVAAQLVRAGELGAFSPVSTQSRWFGARVRNVQETEAATELVEELAARLAIARRSVESAAREAGLPPASTVAGWAEQVELYHAVRRSLETFTAEVYAQDVPAMVAATASSSWRRGHMVEMSSVTRARLRRAAKDVVRPGVHPEDLHAALLQVEEQQQVWRRFAGGPSTPSAPGMTDRALDAVADVVDRLDRLQEVLAPEQTDEAALVDRDVDELAALVDGLVADRETLASLPERTLVLDQLRDHGLTELLEDLHRREVPTEALTSELELAWWQSALEAMISGDDFLAMMDGEALTGIERRYRELDRAHLESGSARLRHQLGRQWKEALGRYRADASVLRNLLKQGTVTVPALTTIAPELLQSLVPVVTTSPMALTEFGDDWEADAVILLEAASSSLATAMGALTRAKQVIAFGDPVLGRPQPFQVSVDPTATAGALRPLTSAYAALEDVLPVVPLRTMHRGLERTLVRLLSSAVYEGALDAAPHAGELTGKDRPVVAHYLEDGTGIPLTGGDAVVSTVADVTRTVELVFEHIRTRPEKSLAVITVSEQHARKIAAAVRATAAKNQWALDFLSRGREEDDHREPFVIAPVVRAAGIVRDEVVLTHGYGRTPHGRVVHHFGAFSDPDGARMVALAFTRARERLHLVSALRAQDLDEDRLCDGALDFYRILEAYFGREHPAPGAGVPNPLNQDLIRRLGEHGAKVRPLFGSVMDMAVWDPQGDAAPLAVASDGADTYTALSVRERSRLLPEALEARGWDPVTQWTIDVFADPEALADRFADRLGVTAPERLLADGADLSAPEQG